ncbi:MAG: hypothetical protein E6J34_20320 [Chloroflexi bacterium]|nr:MAG: hypothetical protein E6J34_20320 [Chloroflexota bacterium]
MTSEDISTGEGRHETPEAGERDGLEESTSTPILQAENTDSIIALSTAVTALVESNRAMQASLSQLGKRQQKLYVPMPEKFDGRIGDKIDAWLKRFETWYRHREQVEGCVVDPREQIDTAASNTEGTISLQIQNYEDDFGQFGTWDDFAIYMKETYGSADTAYTRFMQLRVMTQGNESVYAYYSRFRRAQARQKKRLRPEDNHIYYFMFIAGLEKKINAEVFRMPESLKIEDMEFHEVLELAKRAEQTVRMQADNITVKNSDNSGPGPSKKPRTNKPNSSSNATESSKYNSRDRLTEKEKDFLENNIKRGGGLVVHEHVRNKSEWIRWAMRLGVCIKCAERGHRLDDCKAGTPSKPSDKKLNAMVQDDIDSVMDIDND